MIKLPLNQKSLKIWGCERQNDPNERNNSFFRRRNNFFWFSPKHYVKHTRTKIPANAGNFICGPHLQMPHTQFTSLQKQANSPASSRKKPHADHRVNLPEYSGFCTKFYAELIKFPSRLSCKVAGFCSQKHINFVAKNNRSWKNAAIRPRINSPANCK